VLVSLATLLGVTAGVLVARRTDSAQQTAQGNALRDARSERLARMVAILNALPDTLLVIDGNDGIVELKLAQRSGRTHAVPRLQNVTLDDLFSPSVADRLRRGRDECSDMGHVARMEIELDLAGERRQCEVRMVRADGDHVAALIRDVTEQKVMEHILMDAKATAEAIVAARTELMGSLSHDIRNAMTGVLTMTDVMLHRAADPSSKRYLEIIQRSGEHLVGLVSDIVDFSRLEHGHMPFHTEPTGIRTLVEDAVDFHAGSVGATDLDVCVEVTAQVPDSLVIDGFRFRQLLDNLIGNAIKFTERGEVFVKVAYDHGAIDLSVRDTGVGMSQETLAKIFDVFVQAPNRPRGKQAGSGLGLSIARQLVTSMGGTLTAESREGEGTVFRLVLPCAGAHASDMSAEHLVHGARALVIAAGEGLRASLASCLVSFGFAVDARASIEAEGAGGPYEIVFVDVAGDETEATLGARVAAKYAPERTVFLVRTPDAEAPGAKDGVTLAKPVRRERLRMCLTALGYTGQTRSVSA
jgi:signal transduction histidine kinase